MTPQHNSARVRPAGRRERPAGVRDRQLLAGDGRPAGEPRAAELAHDARPLPGLELQRPRPDQHQQREGAGAGLEHLDRRRPRATRPRRSSTTASCSSPRRYSQVMALNAATGELLWRYKRKLPEGFSALHNTSRGIALYGDKVYLPALDATLVALDAKTGKVAWESKVEDWKTGYYMTRGPPDREGEGHGRRGRRRVRHPRLRRRASTPRAASRRGRPSPCRSPASPAARPGRRPTPGSTAAARPG